MAFIVETGVGLSNATSYSTVDAFKEYHGDACSALPSGTTNKKIEGALIQGTRFLDRRYRAKFIGIRRLVTQSLEFPRINAFYADGRIVENVPPEIADATHELAFRALTIDLAPDPEYDDSNRLVTEFDERVGPIREKKKFMEDGSVIEWRKYPTVEGLIRELIVEGESLKRA